MLTAIEGAGEICWTAVRSKFREADGRRTLMSAAGYLQDTAVLCHAHSDMQEHNRNWIRSGSGNQ